ncbi:MAG: flagellar biosynthesis anti-sigma factor FlgM [Myxococcota bacterium]
MRAPAMVRAPAVPPVTPAAPVGRGQGEHVVLSTLASELASARTKPALPTEVDAAVIDEGRVEAIREAIEQARLSVDPKRIAGAMARDPR